MSETIELKSNIFQFDSPLNLKVVLDDSKAKQGLASLTQLANSSKSEFDKIGKAMGVLFGDNDTIKPFLDNLSKVSDAITIVVSTAVLLKNVKVGLEAMAKSSAIAAAASKLLNATLSQGPFLLVALALTAVTVGFGLFSKKASESSKEMKKLTEETQSYLDKSKDMAKQSQESVQGSLAEIAVLESYNEELKKLTDENGNIISNRERVLFLVEQLNKAFPDSIKLLDGERVAIGEVGKSIDDLIDKKKALAIIDAYSDDYKEFIREKGNLYEQQAELMRELAIKGKIKEQTLDSDEIQQQYGLSEAEYKEINSKNAKDIQTILDNVNESIKLGTTAKNITLEVEHRVANNDLENIEDAYGQYDQNLITFDPEKGTEQEELFKNHLVKLASLREEHKKAAKEEGVQEDEAFLAQLEKDEIHYTEQLKAYNEALANGVIKPIDSEQGTEDGKGYAKNAREAIVSGVSDEPYKFAMQGVLELSVEYKNVQESPPGTLTWTGREKSTKAKDGFNSFGQTIGQFDVFQEDPVNTELMHYAQESLYYAQQGAVNTVLTGFYAKQTAQASAQSQPKSIVVKDPVVNFNQPIKRPSQISKELKKLSQDLARR